MARVSPYQGNFGSGEFSPLIYGRTDADRYKSGLARCLNMIPTLQGGVARRPGTRYVSQTKNNSYTRLVPFKFSQTDAYMLEFGESYIRFYTNQGVLLNGGVPYEVATGYAQSEITTLKFTQSLDTLYIVSQLTPPAKLTRQGPTNWSISSIQFTNGPYLNEFVPSVNGPNLITYDCGTFGGAFASLTGAVVQVLAETISNVSNSGGNFKITVKENVSYLREDDQVRIVGVGGTTSANADWFVKPIDAHSFLLKGSTFSGTYTSGGQSTTVSFYNKYISQDGLSQFRFINTANATKWWNGPVGLVVQGTGSVTFQVVTTDTFPATSNIPVIKYTPQAFGLFIVNTYPTGTKNVFNYPTSIVFHEDRLYLGGSGGPLQRIDGSNVGDYENFAPSTYATGSTSDNTTITDDSAVSFSFVSSDSCIIQWLTSDEKGLCVGTLGGPWIVRPSSLNEAITPTNIVAKRISTFGSGRYQAAVAGKSSIYIEPSGRRLRELTYFYDIDGFKAVDLSELAEHLPAPGIGTEPVFQNTPQNIVWCARRDGYLLGVTYDRTLDTLKTGWHKHLLGGVSDAAGTPPIVESLGVIPSPDGTTDDVWITVKRYINGTTFRSVEFISKIFESFNIPESAVFLDMSATFDNPITINGITPGSGIVSVGITAHGLSTGDKVRFRNVAGLKDVNGLSQINGVLFTITVTDANNFTIPLDSTGLTAYFQDGNAVYRKMVTTVSNITWLEGQTVQILGDGAYLGTAVVTSGTITIPSPGAGTVQFGLGYSSELQQLRLEAGAADGTSFGKLRRINEVGFMVDRTAAFEFGNAFDSNMYTVTMRQATDPLDAQTPLFSGIVDNQNISFPYDTENQICIRQNLPLPFTLLAIMPQQVTQDKG